MTAPSGEIEKLLQYSLWVGRWTLTAPYTSSGKISLFWMFICIVGSCIHIAAAFVYFVVVYNSAEVVNEFRMLAYLFLIIYWCIVPVVLYLGSAWKSKFVHRLHSELINIDLELNDLEQMTIQTLPSYENTIFNKISKNLTKGKLLLLYSSVRVGLVTALLTVYIIEFESHEWFVLFGYGSLIFSYIYQVRLGFWLGLCRNLMNRTRHLTGQTNCLMKRKLFIYQRLVALCLDLLQQHRLEISLLLTGLFLSVVNTSSFALVDIKEWVVCKQDTPSETTMFHYYSSECKGSDLFEYESLKDAMKYFIWIIYGAHKAWYFVQPFTAIQIEATKFKFKLYDEIMSDESEILKNDKDLELEIVSKDFEPKFLLYDIINLNFSFFLSIMTSIVTCTLFLSQTT